MRALYDAVARRLAKSDEAYVLDKDGTLVHQGIPIEGARAFLRSLLAQKRPFVILSNTGVATGVEVARDLSSVLGVVLEPTHVLTAKDMMLLAMRDSPDLRFITVHDAGPTCPMPGEEDTAERTCVAVFTDGAMAHFAENVASMGMWAQRGAAVWMTSRDSSVMRRVDSRVVPFPGPGVVWRAIEAVAPGTRLRNFGKGGCDNMVGRAVTERLRAQGFDGMSRNVVMVGDRLDTDIRTGRNNGWSTCLVETGCHTYSSHAHLFPDDVADTIAANIQDVAHRRVPLSSLVRDLLCTARCRESTAWIADRIARLEALVVPLASRRIQSAPDLQSLSPVSLATGQRTDLQMN